jgi:hypothetical protein
MISSKWENIDPKTAALYLESMEGNRSVRQARVDYYAAQMKAGLWRPTHQGIAFDSGGHLIDGQHRMWAIVESGCTVLIMVSRGVSPEDVVAVDSGLSRDYKDVAHYVGWETDPVTASLAKFLVTGTQAKHMVPPEIANKWYEFYRGGIDYARHFRAVNRASGKLITIAMAAAFARAWYTESNREQLERMGVAMRSGVIDHNADRAALVLRDAMLTKRLGVLASEQYAKTEAAIRAFCERRAITKLQAAESELFPIPKLPVAMRYERVTARSTTNKKKVVELAS